MDLRMKMYTAPHNAGSSYSALTVISVSIKVKLW